MSVVLPPSSAVGEVSGEPQLYWDSDDTGGIRVPLKVNKSPLIFEAPLRRASYPGMTVVAGTGIRARRLKIGETVYARGRFAAQPARIRSDFYRVVDEDGSRCVLWIEGVLETYDRYGIARIVTADESVVKAKLPDGLAVAEGEWIRARAYPATRPANTVRLIEVLPAGA